MSYRLPHAILAAACLLLSACDDTMHANYATAAEARADRAIERGWLPTALPDSAFDISESHDLDTNTGGGSFRFDAGDADSLRLQLQPLPPEQLWRLSREQTRLQQAGYSFHAVSGFVLAVNWQTRHVRFWLAYERNRNA
jgi:hypothetical protein